MDDHASAALTAGDPAPTAKRIPHRVLVVSADMGGGHNATAAALEEAAGRVWPGCEILRIDALDVMGSWVGDAFRRTYVSNVENTPWLYEFFYASLWRHRWFAAASKRFVGTWCGRRLIRHIDAFDPDLVLSTYPLGTAGLAWLISHRGLGVPVASWVSDFAPHPFWVYREVAINHLVAPAAVPVARCAEPHGRYRVSALPVTGGFRPRDRAAARAEFGLRPDAAVVLIGCGSYAFGDVVDLVRTVAEVSERIQVVAACGRNEQTCRQSADLGFGTDRVVAMGWTDRMPELTAAADLVVGNAGGATALEAMACGVPIVLVEPIAAHGAANAALMVVAGVAELCSDHAALAAYLKTVLGPADRTVQGVPRSGQAGSDGRRSAEALDADVAAAAVRSNAGRSAGSRNWPMRASDAFFRHVETTGAAQELGVVLELGRRAGGGEATLADIRASMQPRTCLPSARRVLVPDPPGWRLAAEIDVAAHIDEAVLDGAGRDTAWEAAGDFFAQRLPAGRPAWQMRLIRAGGATLFAIKMHHSQADGISALGLLDRLLDPADDDPLVERRAPRPSARQRTRAATIARGLASLAGRGFASRHPLGDARLSGGRVIAGGTTAWSAVRALAKSCGATAPETSIAVGVHVLQRILTPAGLLTGGVPLRAMVPVAMRAPRLDREFGNWTCSLAADLDMSELPLPERVRQVRDEMRRRNASGEAQAAAAAMAIAGRLPTPLHRAFTRAVYQRRFFSTVVSFMPGARRGRWLAGTPVTAMIPVLPLPPRVPVTVGMIVTDGRLDLGVVLDGRLGEPREPIGRAIAEALSEVG